jgi:2-succinyl-6-hydroxy-2,4-cyclohexadiene-1-carboxylate synthase
MDWKLLRKGDGGTPLVLLHGFMGVAEDWLPFLQHLPHPGEIWAITLPGHCDEPVVGPPGFPDLAEQIVQHLHGQRFLLAGYSLGGRIALHAAALPQVAGLCLLSSSPGLQNEQARQSRAQRDAALAQSLTSARTPEAFRAFLRRWWSQPLFLRVSSEPSRLDALVETRMCHDPARLAQILRAWSPGLQPSTWGILPRISCPVLLLYGEADTRYAELAGEMEKLLPRAKAVSISGSDHALLSMAPEACARAWANFFTTTSDRFPES